MLYGLFAPPPSLILMTVGAVMTLMVTCSSTKALGGPFLRASPRHGRIRGGGGMESHSCEISCKKRMELPRDPRIIAGKKAAPGQIPWQASIQEFNFTGRNSWEHICGGTLIGSRHVLTAAHCLTKHESMYRIVLGTTDLYGKGRVEQVLNYIQHRGKGTPHENDIALVTLTEDVECDGSVEAMCLDGPAEVKDGASCVVTGWGKTKEYGPETNQHLLYTFVPVQSAETCGNLYNDNLFSNKKPRLIRGYRQQSFTENMICAGSVKGGGNAGDACSGDSGGPLVCTHDGRQYLAGLASWSKFACGQQPSVYTKISAFKKWIREEQQLSHPWPY